MSHTPLRVGDLLIGYCGNAFRDSYDDKRVEAIGSNWVVARDERGEPLFYRGDPEDLCGYRRGDDYRDW